MGAIKRTKVNLFGHRLFNKVTWNYLQAQRAQIIQMQQVEREVTMATTAMVPTHPAPVDSSVGG